MIEVRLPSYPLLTIDPLFSIWSATDKLYDSKTVMWTGAEKPINGNINIDGDVKRFMGVKGAEATIKQTKVEASMTATKYTFADQKVELTLTFRSPFLLDDLKLCSAPFAYIDVECKSIDNNPHDVQIVLDFSEKLTYEKGKKLTKSGYIPYPEGRLVYLGRLLQKSLATAGDSREIDWGWLYLAGNSNVLLSSTNAIKKYFKKDNLTEKKKYKKLLVSEKSGKIDKDNPLKFFNVVAYDDINSINYFGSVKKGYWTTGYYDIVNVIQEAYKNHDENVARLTAFDKQTHDDIVSKYDKNYLMLMIASYRQVLAAHKAVKDGDDIIYLSKECHSNGCIGTVDVSYPSIPLFLLKAPQLVKGMLIPIFSFARMACWTYDFAPHDVGVYPFATGQVYGAKRGRKIKSMYFKLMRKFIYNLDGSSKIFKLQDQMPVEECGNMLIMSAAYYNSTGDLQFIKENADLLEKWAEYLVKTGIVLNTQLCTDDFMGRSEKNVNLAIKSVVGIASWGILLDKIQSGEGQKYLQKAASYAKELERISDVGAHTALTIDDRKSWSIKYNLIWDKIFRTNLFSDQLYQKEIALYMSKFNKYGLPLDSRGDITKSDWIMWAATLDKSGELAKKSTVALTTMLKESKSRVPFSDYYNTVTGAQVGFCHRTVQGAMWVLEYARLVEEQGGYLFK